MVTFQDTGDEKVEPVMAIAELDEDDEFPPSVLFRPPDVAASEAAGDGINMSPAAVGDRAVDVSAPAVEVSLSDESLSGTVGDSAAAVVDVTELADHDRSVRQWMTGRTSLQNRGWLYMTSRHLEHTWLMANRSRGVK